MVQLDVIINNYLKTMGMILYISMLLQVSICLKKKLLRVEKG